MTDVSTIQPIVSYPLFIAGMIGVPLTIGLIASTAERFTKTQKARADVGKRSAGGNDAYMSASCKTIQRYYNERGA